MRPRVATALKKIYRYYFGYNYFTPDALQVVLKYDEARRNNLNFFLTRDWFECLNVFELDEIL